MSYENIIIIFISLLFLTTATRYIIYVISSIFYFKNKAYLLQKSKNLSIKEIEEKIRISVIIPAWNEEVGVLHSIKSLLSSKYNNLEIILVDDGSTDRTKDLIGKFVENELDKFLEKGKSFKAYFKENGGKGSALNYGVRKSTGDIIITMDADTIFDKDSLSIVARYFAGGRIDAAVGNVKVGNSFSFLGIIQQIEYTIGFYFKRTHSIFNSEYIIGGAFGIFKKELFEKYGYFDEKSKTEDIEYSTRLQKNGCRIAFIEDAIAYTEAPSTFRGLLKQRFRWKKGRLDTFIKHKELFFSRDKRHSKFLTHYLFPITIFYEIELLIEPFIIVFGVIYLYQTQNYLGLFAWVIFTGIIHTMAFVFGSKQNSRVALSIVPVYFILSYVLTFVEIYAMYASVVSLFTKKEIKWQKWERKGIVSN